MMASSDDYTEIAKGFGVVAERYCAIVDSAPRLEKTELLLQVYRILPELILEATRLPDTDPFKRGKEDGPDDDQPPKPRAARMDDKEWGTLYELLKEKLGNDDLYWTVFDPTEDNEAIRGTLADDIADIYRDIKEGLILTGRNTIAPELVIREWRLGFYSHWGSHAMSALRTIHFLLGEKLTG